MAATRGRILFITHAFFPVVAAHLKADQDNIPLFGWAEDGWLTLCNSPTVNHSDVVAWFENMRKRGFKIRQVGHDRKFCREYFLGMKAAGFKVIDSPNTTIGSQRGFVTLSKAPRTAHYSTCTVKPLNTVWKMSPLWRKRMI